MLRGAVPAIVLALVSVSAASAAPTAGQSCQGSQLKAAGRFMGADFKCLSKYYKSPAADPGATLVLACLTKAADAFASAYARSVELAGPGVCGLEVPVDELLDNALWPELVNLDSAVSEDFLGASQAEESLHAGLHKATGAALAGALAAESKHATKPDALKRQAARAKARAKLLSAFAKAEYKAAGQGALYTGLPADAVADEVDRIVDALTAMSLPPGSAFSVAGTIQVADASLVDSDVNDPSTTPVANDTPAMAQEIPVPGVVGGYVNLAGAGPDGNSRDAGDLTDFFLVSLAAGQRVNLRFGDPLAADLDLCLYAAADPSTALDCSVGTSETEELTAPSSGDFFVEVFAWEECACGSSYVLTLGQVLPTAGPNGVRLSDEFRPGEVVMTLAPKAAGAKGSAPQAAAYADSLGMQALAGAPDREMLLQLPASGGQRAEAFQALQLEAAPSSLHARFGSLPAEQREKLDTLLAVKALHRRTDVAIAEPNFVRHALAVPNDPFFGLQWHYPLINLPAAWDLTTGSTSVEVAVIDTGVLLDHPDLAGQLTTGFDFISNPAQALDGNGIDANPNDPGDQCCPGSSSFHGTHVAGTIGAATNNGSGVSGVAWDVTLVPLRVLGLGGGSNYDVLQAVRYAAGLPNDSGASNKVDVINLSLGAAGGFSSTEQSVYAQARNAGVIVIAAAGNENSSQLSYPASYDGVVSVSAVDSGSEKADYSNFGATVDVAAPGGDSIDRNGDGYPDYVLSTLADDSSGVTLLGFGFSAGTSMASPHVAGVVALMKALDPTLTPAEFDALLASGAITTDLGAPGRDDVFGYGLIDARRAVEAVGGAPNDPILLLSTTGLNLGTSQTQTSFQVTNGDGGSLSVTSVTDDQLWLSVSAASVDGNGLGTYQVSVNRTGLANGTYTGTIAVQSSAGNASVSVVMAVFSAATGADAGFHYVLVVDPETLDTVAQFDVAASDGQYEYDLASVPAGSYYLFAGSDPDNDSILCGTAEACGAYPTLGAPQLVEISGDRSSLDFVTGFLQTIDASAASAGPEQPRPSLRRLRPRQLAR